MIDLHYWTTPNGHKITIFLEEAGLEYAPREAHRVRLQRAHRRRVGERLGGVAFSRSER